MSNDILGLGWKSKNFFFQKSNQFLNQKIDQKFFDKALFLDLCSKDLIFSCGINSTLTLASN